MGKIKFNDLIDRSGFLTELGKVYLQPLEMILTSVLEMDTFKNASEQDLRSLGAVLGKMIADKMSRKIINKSKNY